MTNCWPGALRKASLYNLKKWDDGSRHLLVEDGHDAHHLGPANRFGETPLVAPCELGLRATFNLAHVGDEIR